MNGEQVQVGIYQFPATVVEAREELQRLKAHITETEERIKALKQYLGTVIPLGMSIDNITHVEHSKTTPRYKDVVEWLIEAYVPADKQREVKATIKANATVSKWDDFIVQKEEPSDAQP